MANCSRARAFSLLASSLLALCLGTNADADQTGHTLMRYPILSDNTIVFVAHDNLWSVPRTGGTAWRLTADEGRDVMPRFSPDGLFYNNVSQSFQKPSRMCSSIERCRHCSMSIAWACSRSAMKSPASFAPVSFPNTTASNSSLNNTLR